MTQVRDVSAQRIEQMLRFLAKHPDVDLDWLDQVVEGQVDRPILPTKVTDIAALVRSKIITQTEAKALALTGRMPEQNTPTQCVSAECTYESVKRQLFQLGQVTLHIPLCADHNAKWEKEAARLRQGRRHWGRH